VWIASRYHAGRNRALLGGDFFDVAETSASHLRAIIGDVCGHGPDEAAIGVCLRAAWRALAVAGVDSDGVISALERLLEHERETPHLFTTLCVLEIDLENAAASMVLAGHPPPILIDGASVSVASHPHVGPPIGLVNAHWASAPLTLPDGWAMLLYTDGIIEGRIGEDHERLGTDGLRGLLAEYIAAHPDWQAAPDDLLAELTARAEELNGGELTDDVAMLLVGSRAERRGEE
jgi:serine phosphatase RsbU (regulator of sigma subunit)